MQTSSRRAIQFPSLDRSDRPDVPAHIKYLVDALELDPSLGMGSAAARPANPGYPRYFYWATDTKVLTFWDGSSWTGVGSADVIAQTLIEAKGDLLVGLLDNVVGRLAVGPNGTTIQADNTQPSGMKWGLNQVLDLVAAKGDLLVGSGTDALGRIGVGTDGQMPVADSAQTLGIRWGAPVIPAGMAQLGADVTMTNANTEYDGPALTLGAGKYKLDAIITVIRGGGAATLRGKLWDGTTTYSSVGVIPGGSGDPCAIPLTAVITLAGTTTVKASVMASTTGCTIKAAAPVNSAGNNASTITYIQVS